VVSVSTFYGIPNYGWPEPKSKPQLPWLPIGYLLGAQTGGRVSVSPAGAADAVQERVTLELTDYDVADDGFVIIPGVSNATEPDEPTLPVLYTSRLLPPGSNVVQITWNQGESISETYPVPVPLVDTRFHTETLPNNFYFDDGFYPPTPHFTSTVSSLGGDAVEVGFSIVPVQYDQVAYEMRLWTRMVFDLEYKVDAEALVMDVDGDGLPDYWESGYGLHPYDAEGDQGATGDPDGDELTNMQEKDLGTDPLKLDTDWDGSDDGQEIKNGTDPLNPGSRLKLVYLPVVLRQ
jgi:hypothetical protein